MLAELGARYTECLLMCVNVCMCICVYSVCLYGFVCVLLLFCMYVVVCVCELVWFVCMLFCMCVCSLCYLKCRQLFIFQCLDLGCFKFFSSQT